MKTICHLLYECESQLNVWIALENKLVEAQSNETNCMDKQPIIMGNTKNSMIVICILITKYEMFRNKCKRKEASLQNIIKKA